MTTINSIGINIPIEIVKGGTNASSFATADGIVKYDGTRLVTSSTAKLNSSDVYTNTSHPAFMAYRGQRVNNVTGNLTYYNYICEEEIFDRGSNYSTATGIFTAPIAGVYVFGTQVLAVGTTSATELRIKLVSSTGVYPSAQMQRPASNLNMYAKVYGELNLAAGSTVYPTFYVFGDGADTTDISGGDPTQVYTYFWGYFIG